MLANLEMGAQVFVREGITLAMTNSADADFTSGPPSWLRGHESRGDRLPVPRVRTWVAGAGSR